MRIKLVLVQVCFEIAMEYKVHLLASSMYDKCLVLMVPLNIAIVATLQYKYTEKYFSYFLTHVCECYHGGHFTMSTLKKN